MADVNVTFGATLDDLLSSITTAKDSVAKFGEAMVAAFSVREIANFVTSMGELGLQTERVMATLGVSAEQVGILSGMAQLAGSDIGALALGMERMSLNIQRSTRDAINPIAQSLHVLGLNAKDLVGVSADVYIQRLADAANRFAPSLNLTNALMEVGGRQAAQMVATLRMLGTSWDEHQAKIKATGTVLNDLQASGLARTHEQLTLLGLSVQGLGIATFEAFKPAIDGVVTAMTQFVQWMTNAISQGGALVSMMGILSGAAKTVASAFAAVLGIVRALAEAISTVFTLALGDVESFQKNAETAAANLARIGRETKEAIKEIWTPTIEVPRPTGTAAPAIDFGITEQMKLVQKAVEDQIKLQDLAFKNITEQAQGLVSTYSITEGQKTSIVMAAINVRESAEVAALTAAADKLRANPVAYKSMMDQIDRIHLDSANKRQMAENEADKRMVDSWVAMSREFASAFNSQLRGLLDGTKTWSEAMKATFADMILKMIEKVVELIAAYATLQAVALVTGMPAPSLGAVAGMVGLVPKYQEGTVYVPRTALALLHEGEAVVPAHANPANPQAEMPGALGSTSINLSVNAIDARSFAAALMNQGSGLNVALRTMLRQNPSFLGTAAQRYV